MKARPLIQKGIVDLEKMFSEALGDQSTLRQLRAELKHRNVPRAVVLLKKVEGSLGASELPTTIVGALSLPPEGACACASSRCSSLSPAVRPG